MSAARYSRLFDLHYPVTRPFPYARRLWLGLFVSLTVLSTLFGFVAVATNAYTVQPFYTSNPNATEDHFQWFQKQPFSWLGSLQTKCQDSPISTADTLMTTNRGFVYDVDSLYTAGNATTPMQQLSQIPYHNAELRSCQVSKITYTLIRRLNTDNYGQFWTWARSNAQGYISCQIDGTATNPGTSYANFSVTLPEVGVLDAVTDGFLTQADDGLKSMWYGVQLMQNWYLKVATTMAYARPTFSGQASDTFAEGNIDLFRNPGVTDWRSPDFFLVKAVFFTESGWLPLIAPPHTMREWMTDGTDAPYYLANISTSVDAFGKSFYSLLATDFGINETANALRSSDGVQYLMGIVDQFAEMGLQSCINASRPAGFCASGKADQFNISANANLSYIPPARLVSQYLCSVPIQKSAIGVAYSVVIAVLVFMHAIMAMFVLVAGWILVPAQAMTDLPDIVTYHSPSLGSQDGIPLIDQSRHWSTNSMTAGNTAYMGAMPDEEKVLPPTPTRVQIFHRGLK